jgi:hypothetical protein
MDADTSRLGRAGSSFAVAAAIAIIFNTVIACVKDADKPVKAFMASLSGHDWTTQGIADVVLFVAVGLILWKTSIGEKLSANSFIYLLATAAIVSGAGLFVWYVLY